MQNLILSVFRLLMMQELLIWLIIGSRRAILPSQWVALSGIRMRFRDYKKHLNLSNPDIP